ncbi:MAG: class I SAM-dependent methyltransferase [Methanocellales archaeon]|nr:class I SAM-dependent methyltransferase [Methanocellales archaeon]
MATTKRVYERLAPVYDLDDVMFAGAKQHWRKKIIDKLNIENAKLVLDITTGTGRAAKILSKRVKDGRVIAVDISKNMLKIARMRNRGRDNLRFILCDAAHLPLKGDVFDGVSCMCGMDTVDAPEAVLSEAVRVLKNKGRIGMLYFSEPKGWLRYLDALLKKYHSVIWNTKNVDMASMI